MDSYINYVGRYNNLYKHNLYKLRS